MATMYPKTIGGCIDKLYKMKQRRIEAQRKVDDAKELESLLEQHIMERLHKDKLDGGKGGVATAAVMRRTVARVSDWPTVFKWVKANDAFDLIQKRINDGAFRERLEAGVKVDGVEPFEVESLSLTKVPSKE